MVKVEFKTKNDIKDKPNAKELKIEKGSIELKNIDKSVEIYNKLVDSY